MRATLALVTLLALFAAPAAAQDTPAELRRELDRRDETIAELEARLDRAQERLDELVEENRRLREALRGDTPDDVGPADVVPDEDPDAEPEIPTDPFAGPAATRASVQRAWDDAFAGLDVSDRAQNSRYLREVRRWAGQTERDHRGRFTWTARVLSAREEGRSTIATVEVLDDAGRPVGEPAEIEAVGRAARTVLAAPSDARLLLEGAQEIDLDVDVRHGESGDLVGPYIQYTAEFRVTDARYR